MERGASSQLIGPAAGTEPLDRTGPEAWVVASTVRFHSYAPRACIGLQTFKCRFEHTVCACEDRKVRSALNQKAACVNLM